jgi:hypothetical protein
MPVDGLVPGNLTRPYGLWIETSLFIIRWVATFAGVTSVGLNLDLTTWLVLGFVIVTCRETLVPAEMDWSESQG